ncbi:MAG: hypothetical protein ACR2HZ_11785 [Gemmatimonadaceae bacterium]
MPSTLAGSLSAYIIDFAYYYRLTAFAQVRRGALLTFAQAFGWELTANKPTEAVASGQEALPE